MNAPDYGSFLAAKRVAVPEVGIFDPPALNPALFPFQLDAVAWALRQGRAALFFECGLGKTPMQLEWARVIAERTGRPVLILAPLAVSYQTREEGAKFGIEVHIAKDASQVRAGINVTNYERLGKFDPAAFAGVVLDESSILKSYMGATKRALMEAFAATPYRLCCTATPAPNDHMELGNHCEFLGIMSSHEMLARWFINDSMNFGTYRLKGHAVRPFWDWVASWARAAETPADLGYSDEGYILPALSIIPVEVEVDLTVDRGDGQLFRLPEMNATAIHKEKRRTAEARAAALADIVRAEPGEPWLVWTDTDYEARAFRGAFGPLVEVAGPDKPEVKESRLIAFTHGEVPVLLTKPKIAGFGLNWQHCARVVFMGPTFSFESFYQAVRRVWRFGQAREVKVFVAMAPTERHIYSLMTRKAEGHDDMKRELNQAMRRAHAASHPTATYLPQHTARIPQWLRTR
ncbi:MAG: hypothetical protein NUW01_08455 [Gemmatimonadaceae bacterium]|nr:hypothetical protein [Gemmatimonadaceae bacterium]